jgi:hypothetical protein
MWEIVEVTVAFATITKGNRDQLMHAYDFNEGKYEDLRRQTKALTGITVNQTTVVVSCFGAVPKASKKALTKLLRTKNCERLSKYFRAITKAALMGSLDLWRKHNAHNEKLGNANELRELALEADETLYMEEGEPVTQEEIRNGVNLITELFGEDELAREDAVEVIMHCRGRTPVKTKINRNATDEMLVSRAQREWNCVRMQMARSGLAPLRRPMREGTSITFEEEDSTPQSQCQRES